MIEKMKSNTCLAVLKDKKGKLWFAGDRRQSWGMHKAQHSPRSKVTKRNGVLLAGTGTSSTCDLLTDQFPIPDIIEDSYYYMHSVFMPKLLEFLRENHYVKKDERKLQGEGHAVILVGVNSELYEVYLDSHHIEFGCVNTPYAHGCGGSYAIGSLLTTAKLNKKMSEKQRLTLALEVAASVSPGCDDSVDIIHN